MNDMRKKEKCVYCLRLVIYCCLNMFCLSHNSSPGVNEVFRVRLLFYPCPNSIQDSIEVGDDCGKELICMWVWGMGKLLE